MGIAHEKFFHDVHSVLSRWEFIILRIQTLLLWERVVPSLVFTAFVHIVFLSFVKSSLSTLFISCLALFLILLCNLLQPLLVRLFFDSKCSPGSFAELVSICLENGSIMSTTDLSRWISSGLYGALNIANKLAPCHRNHPLSFFIISSTISIGCILLSLYVSGLTLAYLALNICLILPTLIHHNVISRVWNLIKPILTRVEAEFDKNPLESPEERDAGERELYEPIVAAAHAANSSIFPAGFLTDEHIKPESNQIESEDLDNSEAMFIRQFVSDISSEELDRLFSEALGEHETVVPPQKSKYDNKSYSNNNSNFIDAEYPHILNQEVGDLHSQPRLWAMESEYATDDDESSDIMGEVYPASVTTNKDVEHEGFVFVRKQE
uniref:RETREG1-3/ARL6IP-like N-terminal reticulon-homology domain-containing protein n=1 Tax=Schistosoma japonicum TaxID=6182 RepID=C1L4K5_SCHJA|nr:hypothetical protein [Schistosoma japonicum]